MVFCIIRRRSAVLMLPLAWRSLSRLAIECSPSDSLIGACGVSGFESKSKSRALVCVTQASALGLRISLVRLATARPKTTMSSSELAPRRFAPACASNEAQRTASRTGQAPTVDGSAGSLASSHQAGNHSVRVLLLLRRNTHSNQQQPANRTCVQARSKHKQRSSSSNSNSHSHSDRLRTVEVSASPR